MSTHTPGPWEARPPINTPAEFRQSWGIYAPADDDCCICDLNTDDGENADVVAADARLIAAAPEMRVALLSVQALMQDADTSGLPPEDAARFAAVRWQVDCALKPIVP